MNIPKPHVVFDCNVLLQALARPHGPAAECLHLVESNEVALFVSRAGLNELRGILARPEIRAQSPHLTDKIVEDYLARLRYRGTYLRSVPAMTQLQRDPDDSIYIDLALLIHADFLVTRDKDLLSLADDPSPEAKEIRRRCPHLCIVTPPEFLSRFVPPK